MEIGGIILVTIKQFIVLIMGTYVLGIAQQRLWYKVLFWLYFSLC